MRRVNNYKTMFWRQKQKQSNLYCVSQNQKYFCHCHVELHQYEGMVLIIISAPSEMKPCGTFQVDVVK